MNYTVRSHGTNKEAQRWLKFSWEAQQSQKRIRVTDSDALLKYAKAFHLRSPL